MLLGVNIDHIATIRQSRLTQYPDPVEAVQYAVRGGADSITVHLREDRRHIQERDVKKLKTFLEIPLNLEMALTKEMLDFALEIKPEFVCLVPEKREELTTEGGLNVIAYAEEIKSAITRLTQVGTKVSCFIDPDKDQIDKCVAIKSPMIELHTGTYADAKTKQEQDLEYEKIKNMAEYASAQGLQVNAGHGLNLENVSAITEISYISELNIGHSIIARALFVGLENAVKEVKALLK